MKRWKESLEYLSLMLYPEFLWVYGKCQEIPSFAVENETSWYFSIIFYSSGMKIFYLMRNINQIIRKLYNIIHNFEKL